MSNDAADASTISTAKPLLMLGLVCIDRGDLLRHPKNSMEPSVDITICLSGHHSTDV